MESCSHCGGTLPANATFCPSCGRRTDAPAAAQDVAIDVHYAEPRYFGIAPPVFVFAAALALVVVGVILLANGVVTLGVLAVVVAVSLLPLFLAGARRWPDTRLARVGVSAADRVRDEAGVAAESISTWSRASREVARVRKEQFRLRRERDAKIRELGTSFYSDDGRAEALKAAAKELDEQIAANERKLERTLASARRRVRRGRAAVATTQVIAPAARPEPAESVEPAESLEADEAAADEPIAREQKAKTQRAPRRRQTRSR